MPTTTFICLFRPRRDRRKEGREQRRGWLARRGRGGAQDAISAGQGRRRAARIGVPARPVHLRSLPTLLIPSVVVPAAQPPSASPSMAAEALYSHYISEMTRSSLSRRARPVARSVRGATLRSGPPIYSACCSGRLDTYCRGGDGRLVKPDPRHAAPSLRRIEEKDYGSALRADAAAVRAMARGSHVRTINRISHRIACSLSALTPSNWAT
jgi:hypothetical protein